MEWTEKAGLRQHVKPGSLEVPVTMWHGVYRKVNLLPGTRNGANVILMVNGTNVHEVPLISGSGLEFDNLFADLQTWGDFVATLGADDRAEFLAIEGGVKVSLWGEILKTGNALHHVELPRLRNSTDYAGVSVTLEHARGEKRNDSKLWLRFPSRDFQLMGSGQPRLILSQQAVDADSLFNEMAQLNAMFLSVRMQNPRTSFTDFVNSALDSNRAAETAAIAAKWIK